MLDEIEQIFYSKFIATNDLVGYGLDETICEPTPQEIMCQKSIASMKGLLRARSVVPDRFYLVWHAGTIHEELAQYLRPAADLVALEKYVCRDISEKGLAHAFSVIDREVENLRRLGHLIEPGKGQICHTVLAFDTSERPDLVGPNDMEQVVRYLRQVCPQMRGLGWYNGGYGSYLLKQKDLTAVTDDRHEQAVRTADRLNFEYFIKPCVTLEQNSLKVSQDTQNGQSEFAVALRNIGGMDSGPVEMEMFADGESVGRKTVASVPAGPTAKQNGLVVRQAVEVQKDASRFEVKIRRAPGSTVLNARVVL